MSLTAIDFPVTVRALPPEAASLVAEGRERADAFYLEEIDQPSAGFLAGDYELVHAALVALREGDLLSGSRFCEWGSGLGVIVGLAAQLGYDAFGIEIQEYLTDQSREWLAAKGLTATFGTGTCVPDALRERFGSGSEHGSGSGLANPAPDGYQALSIDPQSIDLFYVYPPPADEEIILDLFDALAKPGAVLLSYRGEDDVLVHRKDD